jgi:hypothetical protein
MTQQEKNSWLRAVGASLGMLTGLIYQNARQKGRKNSGSKPDIMVDL